MQRVFRIQSQAKRPVLSVEQLVAFKESHLLWCLTDGQTPENRVYIQNEDFVSLIEQALSSGDLVIPNFQRVQG